MLQFVLQDLIRIDTRTSQCNETEAAEYLKRVCDSFGIDSVVVEPTKGKGSLVARIPGENPDQDDLLLVSHLDTADFEPISEWRFHPLSAEEYRGRIFGRGAIDCKGLVSIWISLLLEIKQSGIQPERGIVLVAAADEESGGGCGMAHLVESNEWIQHAAFAIGEGGGYPIRIGNTTYLTCQNAEKDFRTVDLEGWKEQEPVIGEVFIGNPWINLWKGIRSRVYNPALAWFLVKQAMHKSSGRRLDPKTLLCSSYLVERTEKGFKYAEYTSPSAKNSMPKTLADKLGREFSGEQGSAQFTALNKELYRLISKETKRLMPDCRVIPYTTPGFSDNRILREHGKIVYGFFPLSFKEKLSGIHGSNENISVSGLEESHRLLRHIVWKFVGLAM